MSPLIGGHEGVGTIVAIAEHTSGSPVKVGDRVGIKWLADSCLNCESCRKGLEQNCLDAKLSGYTTDGTFSQYVVRKILFIAPTCLSPMSGFIRASCYPYPKKLGQLCGGLYPLRWRHSISRVEIQSNKHG
ncbi:hypothetical protein H0H93_001812 [Arthromyces matolae]|nr:hypothetical protein H0H93_001812 [Arthromyces matolae]